MRTSQILTHFGASFLCAASLVHAAAYTVKDNYNSTNFFTEFNFFSSSDPTHGFVAYSAANTANKSGLAGFVDGSVFLGVDHTTTNTAGGRASTRVTSNKAYTHGLFIADIEHM